MNGLWSGALVLFLAAPAAAQHGGGMQHATPGAAGAYSGLEKRDIKALSAEDVEALLAGQGMGLALSAELNHFPGPKHVLELAEKLDLSAGQTAKIEAARAAMTSRAILLGKQIVDQERDLDRRFASGRINASDLRRLTGSIARLQGELRAAHLLAHLEVRALLSAHQTMLYDELRGYAAAQ